MTLPIAKIDQRQQQPHHDQHYYDAYKSHWKTSLRRVRVTRVVFAWRSESEKTAAPKASCVRGKIQLELLYGSYCITLISAIGFRSGRGPQKAQRSTPPSPTLGDAITQWLRWSNTKTRRLIYLLSQPTQFRAF
jgi:hypothetical protein